MLPAFATVLLTLALDPPAGKVPLDRIRTPAAMLMMVAVICVAFATIWLLTARRRARAEAARKKRRRGAGPGAWDESARRLRLPPNDGLDDDDTRDIDPSDLSPGDIDLRPDDDSETGNGKGHST